MVSDAVRQVGASVYECDRHIDGYQVLVYAYGNKGREKRQNDQNEPVIYIANGR